MPLGKNRPQSKFKIITRTARNTSNARTHSKNRDKVKTTFYIEKELVTKIYNFAYWDRHSKTDAINRIIRDGLKNKKTKERR